MNFTVAKWCLSSGLLGASCLPAKNQQQQQHLMQDTSTLNSTGLDGPFGQDQQQQLVIRVLDSHFQPLVDDGGDGGGNFHQLDGRSGF